jgi:hypothetical protein
MLIQAHHDRHNVISSFAESCRAVTGVLLMPSLMPACLLARETASSGRSSAGS